MKVKFFLVLAIMLFSVSIAFSAEEGLIGYWNFNEGTGDIAADSSGNKNDGKLIRSPEWVNGKFGKALKLDLAKTQKVDIANSASFGKITTAVTMEAWVNPANVSGWMSFGVKGDIAYGMFISSTAFVRMHYSGGTSLDTPANAIKANEWTHVVGTYDGKAARIYLNGELKAEVNATAAIPANALTFVIGGTQESRDWFVGMIDEYKLYSRGLTADEVKKSMTGTVSAVNSVGKLAGTWASIK
jgi:hypothetical protein